ncbi:MAG: ComF family protein [Acidimicrobiia bacterium]
MIAELAAIAFPAACPGCGRRAEPVCDACATRLRPARPRPAPPGLEALVVPYAYEGVTRELVARAKYRQRHAALTWCAAAMVGALGDAAARVDAVVWAPTTTRRLRSRGFDQSELLARQVGRLVGRPTRAHLSRRGDGAQTGHSRADRLVTPDFAVVDAARLPGARILLVDDVVTTGATMTAAATTLRSGGVATVVGLAIARRS